MSGTEKAPMTMAVRLLTTHGVEFTTHLFRYEDRGGTSHSAEELGVDEHSVIKTLIMEDERKKPLVVLMHGDLQVSTKQLARELGVKTVTPCAPAVADRHSGYQVGGTSPFGTRQAMPVYAEKTIFDLPRIFINGGRRGFLVGMEPRYILEILHPKLVLVGVRASDK